MEQHKYINGIDVETPDLTLGAHSYFERARKFAEKYYSDVILDISSKKFSELTAEIFFREYVWVVYTSGFSAKAVSRFFDRLINAYGDFSSLTDRIPAVNAQIMNICANKQKLASVVGMASILTSGIQQHGWSKYRDKFLATPELLTELPYIGKITCFHLARNIGILDVVKPDLHLVRAAKYWGYKDCLEMCKAIQPEGMPLGIVDLILWFSMSTFGTKEIG